MRRFVICLITACTLLSLLCILMPVEICADDTPVNLITNGSCDSTGGWSVGDNWSILNYSDLPGIVQQSYTPSPGNNSFFGAHKSTTDDFTSEMTQIISIPSDKFAAIDAGSITAQLSADYWSNGVNGSEATLILELLDADGNSMSPRMFYQTTYNSSQPKVETSQFSNGALNVVLSAGTRKLKVTLKAVCYAHDYEIILGGTAEFDNIQLLIGSNAAPSAPPTISSVSDQETCSGQLLGPLPLTVGDDGDVADLIMEAASSNPQLIPSSNITFGGSGADRTVSIVSVAGQTGEADIILSVKDATNIANTVFHVTVFAHEPLETNLVQNGDASQGPGMGYMPGWSNDCDYASFVVDGSGRFVIPDRTPGTVRLNQYIDISWLYGLIDTSQVNFSAGAYLGGGGALEITFRNAANVNLESFTVSSDAWQQKTIMGVIPANTRIVKVSIYGQANDQFDDVTFRVTNDFPKMSNSIAARTIVNDRACSLIPFNVGYITGSVDLSATSSNTGVINTGNIVFGGTKYAKTLTITPVSGAVGSSAITINADFGGQTKTVSFQVSVVEAARIVSISLPANKTYKPGENLDFTVTLSAPVTVSIGGGSPGIPLALDTGGNVKASYVSSGSTSTSLMFRYTVKAGDMDANGITLGSAINLDGGNIIDNVAGTTIPLELNGAGSTAGIKIDGVPPYIVSKTLASDNSYMDITFNEGIYGAGGGAAPLTASRLSLTFTKNGGTTENTVISSVKKDDNTVESEASALTGGETIVRVFLLVSGTASGAETVEIKPANASSVFDISGNAVVISVSTGSVKLNDKIAPATPEAPLLSAASDTGISDSDGITSDNSPELTGMTEPESTVTIYNGDADVLGTATAGSTGEWVFHSPILPDGSHEISATATDASGNTSVQSGTLTLTVDTSAPSEPAVPDMSDSSDTGPSSSDDLTNITRPVFSGTAEAGSYVELFSSAAGKIGSAVADGTGAWTFTPASPLAEGAHDITVKASDTAGNPSVVSPALAITIDTSSPALSISAPSLTDVKNEAVSFTVNFTGADTIEMTPAHVSLNKTGNANGTISVEQTGPAVRTVIVSDITGDGTLGITISEASAGDYAGNIAAQAGPSTAFSVDNTPPTLVISSPSALLTGNGDVTYTVTYTGASSITLAKEDVILNMTGTANGEINISGSGTDARTVTISNITGDGTLGISLPAGTASDPVGNICAPSGSSTLFAIDNTSPDAPGVPNLDAASDTGRSDSDGITKSSSLALNGSVESNCIITVCSSTAGTLGSAAASINGDWDFITQPLAAGRHELTVTAADAVGNVSSPSAPLVVTIDAVVPSAPSVPDMDAASDSGSSNSDDNTNIKNAVFSGTAEAYSIIRLYSSADEIGSAIADSDGKWSITAAALADGIHAITAMAEDIAGNTSPFSGALSVTIDTAKPSAPDIYGITKASDLGISDTDGITCDNTPVFTGTAETGAMVVINSFSLGDVGSVTAGQGGDWSITPAQLQDGVYVMTVKCMDSTGNISDASAECTVVIDTDRPVMNISAPSSAITGSDGVTFMIDYSGADSITIDEANISLIKTGTANGTVSVSGTAANEKTVLVSSISGDGTLAIWVSAGTAADIAGNAASAFGPSAVFTVDNSAPVVPTGQIVFSGLSTNGVTLEWTKATDNICAQNSLKYLVYRSSSDNLSTVSDIEANGTPLGLFMPDINSSVISGLTPSTTYYINVIVSDEAGNKSCYSAGQVTTKQTPSTTGGGETIAPVKKNDPNIEVLKEGLSTVTVQKPGGQLVTTIAVDSGRILERLENAGIGSKVIVEVSGGSNIITSMIDGDIFKTMGQKKSVLEFKAGNTTYTLPAAEIDIADVYDQIGQNAVLKDIKVNVTIAEPPADTIKIVEDTADKNNYQVVVKPVDFKVYCSSGSKTVEVDRFSGYVERMAAIPDGIDPSKITTGIILNRDGTFSHVPTTIILIDGKYFAKINSLTNSTYSVIYNKAEFSDTGKHWAAADIADMASRLIIDGVERDIFGPELKITRGEFIDAVIRALGLKDSGAGQQVFDDVDERCPYFDSIFTAYQYKFTVGSGGGLFKPDSNITRQEAMTILTRVMPLLKMDPNISDKEATKLLEDFSDGKSLPGWARNKAAACIRSGIMEGSNGKIMGSNNITKAQTAVVLKRMLKKAGLI